MYGVLTDVQQRFTLPYNLSELHMTFYADPSRPSIAWKHYTGFKGTFHALGCPPGAHIAHEGATWHCRACVGGKYSTGYDELACGTCPANAVAGNFSTRCQPCELGTFSVRAHTSPRSLPPART